MLPDLLPPPTPPSLYSQVLDAPLLIGRLCRDTSRLFERSLSASAKKNKRKRVLRVFRHCGSGIFLSCRCCCSCVLRQKKKKCRVCGDFLPAVRHLRFFFIFVVFTRIFFPLYGITPGNAITHALERFFFEPILLQKISGAHAARMMVSENYRRDISLDVYVARCSALTLTFCRESRVGNSPKGGGVILSPRVIDGGLLGRRERNTN